MPAKAVILTISLLVDLEMPVFTSGSSTCVSNNKWSYSIFSLPRATNYTMQGQLQDVNTLLGIAIAGQMKQGGAP